MKKENIIIRNEREDEQRTVENLVRESFWNVYRPGCMEHYVLKKLRRDPGFREDLNFVLCLRTSEQEERVIGQVVFVEAEIHGDDGRTIPIATFGPISISPEYKRKGYGKILLDYALEKAAAAGCKVICMEGNIDFYGKCGFAPAYLRGIRCHGMPEGEVADFLLLRELEPGYLEGVTGEYVTPAGYFAVEEDPEEFAAYEASFPAKEKLVLPGQLFPE